MSEITTADDILKKIRLGYKQDLKVKLGDYEIPCRLMSATEERRVIASAKAGLKVLLESARDLEESLAVMKAVILRGCTVDNTPRMPQAVLDELTNSEIESLYDQYLTVCTTVNPEFESLSEAQIVDLIKEVKKKNQPARDLFTWQLVAIGKYFLDVFLPAANAPGS